VSTTNLVVDWDNDTIPYMNFSWQHLNKPFLCLAPMEGVTDAPFRQVVVECGRPDILFTEFVNVEGLTSEKGKPRLEHMLLFEPNEQPLIAQIWGLDPENFFTIAQDLVVRGFAGVDINMGCPYRPVVIKGAGGGLINNPQLAREIILAVKEGVAGKIPVSVKTRIGFNTIVTEEWISMILEQRIDALTVHGRTVKEQSLVPVHWDEIKKVVDLKKQMKLNTVIIGNGDVLTIEDGKQKVQEFGLDGIMIGRGVFHNPWVFNSLQEEKTKLERVDLLLKHVQNHQRLFASYERPFDPLKRFFKIYIQSFEGAADLRDQLMHCDSYVDVYELLETVR
jgi:tRNA-dihydrouridine synthase